MAAIRYIGNVSIRIEYTGNATDDYVCTLRGRTSDGGPTVTGKCKVTVRAPAAGFGPGIAYDSPEAFDSTARAALAFAADGAPRGMWAQALEAATFGDGSDRIEVRRTIGHNRKVAV
jgi:hypothetical protein